MWIFGFMAGLFILLLLEYLLYRFFSLRGFAYHRSLSETDVYVGEHVSLIEVISNNSALPIPWLRAESRFDESLSFAHSAGTYIASKSYHRSIFSIMPFRRVRRRYDISCDKRGLFRLHTTTVTTGDIFGFVHVSRLYEFDNLLFVYPQPLNRRALELPTHSWQGDLVVRRYILDDPFMIAGVRDYMPRDPMSMISWKATARTGSLQVYTRDFTADVRLLVAFNTDYREDQWTVLNARENEVIEYGIRLLAMICERALSAGLETGIVSNGTHKLSGEVLKVPSRCGLAHMKEIHRGLAALTTKRVKIFRLLLEDLVEQGITNTDILVMTRFIDKGMQDMFGRLRANGNAVEILSLPDIPEPASKEVAS